MKTGDLIFYKNIPEFGSWLQRIVTNTIYSHVSILAGYNKNIAKLMEFDASHFVRFRSFFTQSKSMDVMILSGVSIEVKIKALRTVVDAYEGRSYGYIQWLTIALRFLFQWMGFRDTRGWNILWGWGITCSELVYAYLIELCRLMEEEGGRQWRNESPWARIQSVLKTYNSDLFVPEDINDLSKMYPNQLRWADDQNTAISIMSCIKVEEVIGVQ